MGLFNWWRADCAICSKQTGLTRFPLANDKCLCPKCFNKCGFTGSTPVYTITMEQAQNALQESEKRVKLLKTFVARKKVGFF